jgi:3-oxoacyl-[acyl-carrier protein] reductase
MTSGYDFSDQVALVTGAAGGLGRASCAMLAMAGAHVVAADVDGEAVSALEGKHGRGGHISGARLDVRDRAAVETTVAAVVAEFGRIDIVVNLAGVLRNQLLVKIEDNDFDLVIGSHVKGTLNTLRAAIPVMRTHGYGRIVNMSSVALRGSIAGSAYGAAKGAIEGMTRSVAMEVAPHGVTVNCVAPGLTNAGMFLSVDPEYQRASAARIPMRRLGEADEVAACIAFLASKESAYVTGQTLVVCGGLSLGF